ncbi:MAG: hypothetical protein KGI38_00565 [Thaumarchaeota archaeon]|nr:hypothetical protein [Nitrososphaerota archaeon]
MQFASEELSEKPLDAYALVRVLSPQSNRMKLFASLTWTEEEYPIEELGTVLPKCGDIPAEVAAERLPRVVEYVRRRSPPDSTSAKYILDLAKAGEALERVPPIIVEPGSLQRNGTVMKRYWGKTFEVDPCTGYIEDGNHRAIAMALADNRAKIRAFVGR